MLHHFECYVNMFSDNGWIAFYNFGDNGSKEEVTYRAEAGY